jgi:hypothetical protein
LKNVGIDERVKVKTEPVINMTVMEVHTYSFLIWALDGVESLILGQRCFTQ